MFVWAEITDFWDRDWNKASDFMGFVQTSIYQLFSHHAAGTAIPLSPGEPGHAWGGVLHVDEVK
jgi:hypothetical protein